MPNICTANTFCSERGGYVSERRGGIGEVWDFKQRNAKTMIARRISLLPEFAEHANSITRPKFPVSGDKTGYCIYGRANI